MRPLAVEIEPYAWAPSTEEVARMADIDPVEVLRFDANVPAVPPPSARPGTLARAVAEINTYPHGGYTALTDAIAAYASVKPDNVVLGAGADDLIMLAARAFAGPGDTVAIADQPTYPVYRQAAIVAGAQVVTSAREKTAVLTFCCRPNNPTGALEDLPSVRPLVVDEAYHEYAGVTAKDSIEEGVVVLRTFSKAFGLAGGRVGYALAGEDVAADLRARQSPAPVSTLSAELALAALAEPPDVTAQVEERERLASRLRSLGLEVAPSHANFVFVPMADPAPVSKRLQMAGILVRPSAAGIRVTVRDEADDEILIGALELALEGRSGRPQGDNRRARLVRATSETCIRVRLDLDGARRVAVRTGAGLYDHLLEQLAFHAGIDLFVEGVGDLETGVHHTAEDSALAVGTALEAALGDRRGVGRYGSAAVPMDEALGRAIVDLGGRAFAKLDISPDPGLAEHVLASLAQSARIGLHVTASGRDGHHTAEAAFKAVGRALAVALERRGREVASTKGIT